LWCHGVIHLPFLQLHRSWLLHCTFGTIKELKRCFALLFKLW
jgi:hypothetical protein